MWTPFLASVLAAGVARAQVTAAFPNGATNPDKPEFLPIGAQVNMTSFSRLLTLNGVDDFCMYGPPDEGPDSLVGNVEDRVVAWCTKPRNDARLIPDGAIQAAHFIKTPLYVQIYGFWDGTKLNIPYGDSGGELDPHGAKNLGNPIGGNVTSNVATGTDVFYEEWMSFISYDQFCLRICTAETSNVTAALQCEHELDIMGCRWVMAIEDFYQSNNTFTSCEGEAAAPPGLYPQADGSTSTFRQRYTGTWSQDGTLGVWTVGQTVTPSAPAFWPATSNCVTYSTISNGVATTDYMVTAAPTIIAGPSSSSVAVVGTTSMATVTTPKITTVAPTATGTSEAGSTAGAEGGAAAEGDATGSAAAAASTKASGAGQLMGGSIVALVAGALVGAAVIF